MKVAVVASTTALAGAAEGDGVVAVEEELTDVVAVAVTEVISEVIVEAVTVLVGVKLPLETESPVTLRDNRSIPTCPKKDKIWLVFHARS